jgi:hypothetical protein
MDKSTPESRMNARRDVDAPSPGDPARQAPPNPKTAPDPESNTEKDPSEWVSGGDRMTGAQASYLKTLSEETGSAAFRDDLTKAEAAMLIDELKSARDERR